MRLQIMIFLNDTSFRNGSEVFERIIDVDNSLSIPYESLVTSLRFMFGFNSIISFNLM